MVKSLRGKKRPELAALADHPAEEFAGYSLFTLAGVAGFTEQTGVQVSWDPSIGALLSIGGCAACVAAAIVMLRTRPPAPGETR